MDPLNFNIGMEDVSTAISRLEKGDYIAQIDSAEVVMNKDQTGYNLKTVFATVQPGQSTTGDTIHPGYKLTKYYPLQQSPKENAPDFRRDIAILLHAAFQVTDPAECPALNPDTIAQLKGRQVVLRVILRDSDEYGLQNEIKSVNKLD